MKKATTKLYQLYEVKYNGKEQALGTYSSLEKLAKAWTANRTKSMNAYVITGEDTMLINDQMPQRATTSLAEFSSAAERDAHIIANAKYYTIVRRIGVREGYERNERNTREEAEALGKELSEANKSNYLIYAVGPHNLSAYVATVYYKRGK